MVEENWTEAQIPLEQSSGLFGESTTVEYKIPFMNHKEGEGAFINPSLFEGWGLKVEVCWSELRFEAKSRSNVIFANWLFKLLTNPVLSRMIIQTGIKKVLNLSKVCRQQKSWRRGIPHFLVEYWIAHVCSAWGEFCPPLEDVVVFPVFLFLEKQRPSNCLRILWRLP